MLTELLLQEIYNSESPRAFLYFVTQLCEVTKDVAFAGYNKSEDLRCIYSTFCCRNGLNAGSLLQIRDLCTHDPENYNDLVHALSGLSVWDVHAYSRHFGVELDFDQLMDKYCNQLEYLRCLCTIGGDKRKSKIIRIVDYKEAIMKAASKAGVNDISTDALGATALAEVPKLLLGEEHTVDKRDMRYMFEQELICITRWTGLFDVEVVHHSELRHKYKIMWFGKWVYSL